jgi:hypothetical protein
MTEKPNHILAKVEYNPDPNIEDTIEIGYGRKFFNEQQKKIGELTITLDDDITVKAEIKLEF